MLITYMAQNGVFGTSDNQLIRNYFLTNIIASGFDIEQLATVYVDDYGGLVPFAGDEVHGDVVLIEGAHPLEPDGTDFAFAVEKTQGHKKVFYIQWDNQHPKEEFGWTLLTTQMIKDRKSVRTEMPKCLVDDTTIETAPDDNTQDDSVLLHARGMYWKQHEKLIDEGLLIPRDYWGSHLRSDEGFFLDPMQTSFYEEAKKHKFSLILTNQANLHVGNIPSQFFLALMSGSLPLLDNSFTPSAETLLGRFSSEFLTQRNCIQDKIAELAPNRIQLINDTIAELRATNNTTRTMDKLTWAFKYAS